jgi:hypothetical protein
MSDQAATTGAAMPPELTKRIVPFEEDNPSIEPLFINCAQGAGLGDDFYLDVGVVTLESVNAKDKPVSVGEFAVISRLVMSRRTAILVRDQMNFLLARHDKAKEEEPNASSQPIEA